MQRAQHAAKQHWAREPLWLYALRRHASSAADSTGGGGSGGGGEAGSSSGGAIGGAGGHQRDRNMAMVFTCKKCDTRAAKTFSRHSYDHGIVIITCPGCQSKHLIADHLGWFEHGEKGFRIEDLLRARGERVLRVAEPKAGSASGGGASGSSSGAEGGLSPEDVAGWSKVQELIQATGQGGGSSGDGSSSTYSRESSGGSGAAPPAGGGVLSVSPEDLDAWARVAAAGKAGGEGPGGGGGGGA